MWSRSRSTSTDRREAAFPTVQRRRSVGITVRCHAPLSEVERQVLNVMLAQDFPGAVELGAQVTAVQVVRTCDCGCPTVDLMVEGDVPLAAVTSRTPVNAVVDGVVGGGLIVFVDDGRLSGLEYYSAEDKPRRELPELDQVRPYV